MVKPACKIVVALTTYKGRIYNKKFPMCLYSIIRQKTAIPYKVVLVLSTDEFKKKSEIPEEILLMDKQLDVFEILYTKRNTKALKKYNPVFLKYYNLPIISIGDDTIYSDKLVDTCYAEYLKNPFACHATRVGKVGAIRIPWRVRLFPPNCMSWINEDWFEKCFHQHDDLFYGLRLLLSGTPVIKHKEWECLIVKGGYYGQEKTLGAEYKKQTETEIIKQFFNELLKPENEFIIES